MPDTAGQRHFEPRTVSSASIRMMWYVLLPVALGLCVGYSSAVLETRALFFTLALVTGSCLVAKGNSVIPVSVAVAMLVLVPKSLPALRIGSFSFGWGIGDSLVFLALGLAIVSSAVSGRGRFLISRYSALDRAAVLYAIALMPAMIVGILQDSGGWALSVGSYVKSLEAVMVYITVRLTHRHPRSFAITTSSFLGIALGVVSIAFMQLLAPATYIRALSTIGARSTSYSDSFLQSIGWRLAGPFLNANTLGAFIIVAVPFMMAVAATTPRQSLGRRLVPLLYVGSLVVLVFTLSRSSYVGLFVAFSYLFSQRLASRRLRRITLAGFLVILAGLWYFAPLLYRRVILYTFAGGEVSLSTIGSSASANARIEQWAAGFRAIGSYGILGAGFGHVAEAVGRYLPPNSPSYGGIHQTFLRALLEGGTVSLLGLLYLLRSIWVMARRLPTNYRISIRSSLLGLAVTGLFGDTFQNVEVMVPVFYLLAGLQAFTIGNEHASTGLDERNDDRKLKAGALVTGPDEVAA